MGMVTLHLDAKGANAFREFRKLTAAQQQLETATAKTAATSARASNRATAGHKQQLQGIMRTVGGVVSLAAAYRLASAALKGLHDERKKGARTQAEGVSGYGKLVQISKDDKDFARNMAMVRNLRIQFGVGREPAITAITSLRSAGYGESERKVIGGLTNIVEPLAAIEFASKTQTGYKGKAGSFRAVLAKGITAARVSLTPFEEFAGAVSTFAKPHQAVGGTDEEGMAVLAHLTKATRSPEVAGTQLRALTTEMGKKGMRGGFIAAVKQINAMNLTEKQFIRYMPNVRAREAVRGISDNMSAMMATEAELRRVEAGTGKSGDLLNQMENRLLSKVPGAQVNRLIRGEAAAAEIAREGTFGQKESERRLIAQKLAAGSLETGGSPTYRALNEATAWGLSLFGAEPATMKRALEIAPWADPRAPQDQGSPEVRQWSKEQVQGPAGMTVEVHTKTTSTATVKPSVAATRNEGVR